MSNNNVTPLVACPTCQNKIPWSKDNIDRPFCSARCRLVDLGEWANESYIIPQQTSDEDEIFSEDLILDTNKSFL